MTGVAALLHLPPWRGNVRHVAGPLEVGAVREVVLDDGRNPAWMAPGVLLCLTVASAGPGDAWRMDAHLRRAADAGCVAVLLPAGTELSAATRLLSSRLGICVLESDLGVLSAATAASVALAAPEVHRARALRTITAAAASGRVSDGADLVALLHQLLDVPVGLLDATGTPLHVGGGDAPPAPRVAEPVQQRLDLAVGTLVAQPVLLPGLREAQRWFVALLPPHVDVETVVDCLAASAATLAGRLGIERLQLERDARARAGLFADVLRSGQGPEAELRRRAAGAGWPLEGWHVGIRIGTAATTDTAGGREEVSAAFTAVGLRAVVVEHGDGWSAWLTLPRPPAAETVRTLAEQLRRVHRRVQKLSRCWTGVGRPHPGPSGIARTLAEAADAAGLANGRSEQGNFLHVDQLGVAQTLLAWTRTGTFPPAARSLLEPLGPPDGELVTTLTAYLDAESSLVQTAAALGVHRNTVAARIARIQQVLQVDLADRDQRLALHLACRAVDPR